MDETEIKHVLEAALLAAGRPLTLDRLTELFSAKGSAPERATIKRALEALANDYQGRGIEIKEVASGYRVQVKRSVSDWLTPLWEERAPRYTRALLETLALVAYRQPITRAEIEEVRGVVVSTNIIRTLLERGWVRVVGHRDVPGKPAMFGTTREFLDYFGLKKLEDLPPLAELKDGLPELNPQADLIESLEAAVKQTDGAEEVAEIGVEASGEDNVVELRPAAEHATETASDESAKSADVAEGEDAEGLADGADAAGDTAAEETARDEPSAEARGEHRADDSGELSTAEVDAVEAESTLEGDAPEDEDHGAEVIPLRARGGDGNE
jgi:segregation and condensation protein B